MDETVNVSYDPGNLHALPSGTFLRRRYQLQRMLGQGGFGITYLGWDHQIQMPVAIKEFFPRSIVSRDCSWSLDVRCTTQSLIPSFRSSKERFLREAGALGRFRDVRAIVEIKDFFEENNTAYIVMEYIAGVTLKDYITRRGGKLSIEETLGILEPVIQALIQVHQAGLVHRDISPDNIMLHPADGAKLLDFGAVRSVENPQLEKELSHSTEAILKHGFAPIEQYHSRGTLGPWTDEYALCGTIYYCLTGRVPEPVPTRMTEDAHPDWNSIPGLTPGQRSALEKGMAVRAKDRFPGVGQLYEALYSNRNTGPVPVPTPGKPWKKLLPGACAAVLALALGVGIWAAVARQPGKKNEDGSDPTPVISVTERPDATVPSNVPTEAPSDTPTEAPSGIPGEESPTVNRDWINNVMVSNPLDVLLDVRSEDTETILESRKKIRSITFLDDVRDRPGTVSNLGVGGTDAVVGWLEWSGGSVDVYIGGNGGIDASESCVQLFYGCVNVVSINFGTAFHTDGCEDMFQMFSGCHELRSLDVSNFDTSCVTNMREMFRECRSLTELDVSNFDTSRVTTMQEMFRECQSLIELDVSNFVTSRVTNMNAMFSTCLGLTYLDLRSFDTSSVTNMGYMFSANRYLRNVDVSSFNTSRVINMAGMFRWCSSLEDMDLSGWSIAAVEDYSGFMNDDKTVNGRPWNEFFQK